MIILLCLLIQDKSLVERPTLATQDEFKWKREFQKKPEKAKIPFKVNFGYSFINTNGSGYDNGRGPKIGIEFGDQGFIGGFEIERYDIKVKWVEYETVTSQKTQTVLDTVTRTEPITVTETANVCTYFAGNPYIDLGGDLSGLPWYVGEMPLNMLTLPPILMGFPPEALTIPVKEAWLFGLPPGTLATEPWGCEFGIPLIASRNVTQMITVTETITNTITTTETVINAKVREIKADFTDLYIYGGYRFRIADIITTGTKAGFHIIGSSDLEESNTKLGAGVSLTIEVDMGSARFGLDGGLRKPINETRIGPQELKSLSIVGGYLGFKW